MKNSNQSIKKQCTCGALKGTQFHSGNCALAVPPKSHRMSCDCGHPGIGYINMPQSEREECCGHCPNSDKKCHKNWEDCSPKLEQPKEHGNQCAGEYKDWCDRCKRLPLAEQPNQEWQDRFENLLSELTYPILTGVAYDITHQALEKFISQTLLLEKQRIKKKIENRIKYLMEQRDRYNYVTSHESWKMYDDKVTELKMLVLKLLEDKDE